MTGKISKPLLALGILVAVAGTAVVAGGQENSRHSKYSKNSRKAEGSSPSAIPPRCHGNHPVRGRGHRIDLVRVEAGYRELAKKLALDLKGAAGDLKGALNRAHDAQLPACRGDFERRVRFAQSAPLPLRGRKMAFLREGDQLPRAIQLDSRAGIFVVKVSSLKSLETLADRWGRPVSLADEDFAKAFSVQCAPAWIEIDATGREGMVHEYR